MPRIPETEIDRIKQDTDLVALIQSRGVKLKQQGKNWTGLCPFHSDKKTPNLIVTPCKGLFRCMASNCGKTGNALHFVQFHDGVSFRHAFEILDSGKAAFTNTVSRKGRPPASPVNGLVKQSTVPKLPCPLDAKADESKLLAKVSEYYHGRLASVDGHAALDYLKSRGLDDEAMVKRFKIGLSDRTLGLRLPKANRREGRKSEASSRPLAFTARTAASICADA